MVGLVKKSAQSPRRSCVLDEFRRRQEPLSLPQLRVSHRHHRGPSKTFARAWQGCRIFGDEVFSIDRAAGTEQIKSTQVTSLRVQAVQGGEQTPAHCSAWSWQVCRLSKPYKAALPVCNNYFPSFVFAPQLKTPRLIVVLSARIRKRLQVLSSLPSGSEQGVLPELGARNDAATTLGKSGVAVAS